ncbi:UNVERIFIED_CONTAM: hypothetical protein FKN15_071532 [Acipenser sinensis]
MAAILTAYLDGVLTGDRLPEPVATELRLLSSTLLQISGLQGQALGWSLASLVVARRQLWLFQARVAAFLPPCAPVRGKLSRWQAPQACTITRTVPVPMALLGDLRHCLQATAVMGNQASPQTMRNTSCGTSTQQRSRRKFQGRCPRHLPQSAPPQPQQTQQRP